MAFAKVGRTQLISFAKKQIISKNPYSFEYEMNDKRLWEGTPEDSFITEDGREIPVYRDHRYKLKKCWSVYGPVAALRELISKELVSDRTKAFFKECIGHRTITKPFDEIREEVKPYIEKHENLFISKNIPDIGKRLMKPTSSETVSLINRKGSEHQILIESINRNVSKKIKSGDKVLEIGYTSGGESVIAFEKCGLKAIGIDNYYHDAVEATNRHECVVKNYKNETTFLRGDITRETEIEESSLDLVYSLSVIEHITDLEGAFREMYRILKPGAVMFHRYDPYFHILGGHSHSTLDSPWAHLRLSEADVERYIKEFRPYEAPVTLPWVKNALNRKHSQSNVLGLLSKVGFKVSMWQNVNMKPENQQLLTNEIITDCIGTNNDKALTISDLNSGAVAFLAEKPMA